MPEETKTKPEELQIAVKLAAERLHLTKNKMLEQMGSVPFGGEEVTPDEALVEYLSVRDNPAKWREVLQDNVRSSRDGRLLIRKKLATAIVEMERKIKEGSK